MEIEWIYRRVNVGIDYRGAQWKGGRMKSGRKRRRWGARRWLLKATRNEEPWRLQKLGLFFFFFGTSCVYLSSPLQELLFWWGGRLKREEFNNNPRRCRNMLASSSSFVYSYSCSRVSFSYVWEEASYLGVVSLDTTVLFYYMENGEFD